MSQSPHIFDATEENFATAVIEASREVPVMVDFWAAWCGPCKSLMPVVTALAEAYQGQFRLAKVNIDEQQGLAMQFGVRSVPTVKLFRHGQVVDEFLGAQPEGQIRAMLERHIERASDRMLMEARALLEAGKTASALELARQAVENDPENHRAKIAAAELLIDGGETAAAETLLRGLPVDVAAEPQVAQQLARLEFAREAASAPPVETLEARLAADPADSEARYQLAMRHLAAGDYEAALEGLLELMRHDRKWGDDAGRKGLLKVFELLGGEGDLVTRYRARMFNILY